MTKIRFLLTPMVLVAASVALASPARASMVAGWDFSQYLSTGALTIDGATGADTLSANYSNLDPTASAGAESAAYGTMFINGLHGSTAVDPFGATPEFLPTSGSLVSNLNAPVGGAPGAVPFDSQANLQSEGQMFFNVLSMTAPGSANVVFEATTAGSGEHASDWGISFGGKTFSGTSSVGVSYSLDGVTYSPEQILGLTTVDTPFTMSFGSITADTIFVRLSLSPEGGQPIIDNVALNATLVPEPGTVVLLGAALAGLGLCRRRSV